MNAPQQFPIPERIVLDGSPEALAVMFALEQMFRNAEQRRREREERAA